MANAIIARQQGDDYQSRFFWLQACRLFQPHTKVARVGFELSRVKSFDDVVVIYNEPLCFERGDKVGADYFQVKFHVSQAGAFTCDALIDPGFINATSVSLLQRLRDAQIAFASDGVGCRFIIVSPWVIHPDDPLAEIVSNNGGELRLHILFDGTTDGSRMGKVRKKWREHLGIADDRELATVLRPLRIFEKSPTLVGLSEDLNRQLDYLGFVPVEAGRAVHPYDDLIKKLLAQGSNEFSRDELHEIARREQLWRGRNGDNGKEPAPIGIRSFMRWAEHMEDETEDMLCLVRHFDNRNIRDRSLWQGAVLPEVLGFMSKHARLGRAAHLMLDAHASIAFAAGYGLESKSGADIVPVQRTRAGIQVWCPDPAAAGGADAGWSYSDQELRTEGHDVAVALSVTHDVLEDVKDFVGRELPQVSRIMAFAVEPRPSPASVRDATHALALTQELAARLKGRTREERGARLHIFAAAPNAFMFLLGQLAKGFGPCTMYEYDFDTSAPGAYQASVSFPPRREAQSTPVSV
jgi:SMODS-associated and fused to various effectors sensor domain